MTPEILARLAAAAGSTTTVMSAHDERGTRSSAANPLIRVIEDATRFYLECYYDNGHGYLAHMHDPLAAAVALDPQLVTTRPATVDVELTGTLTRGMTVTDWSGRWGREAQCATSASVSIRRCSSTGSSNGSDHSRTSWARRFEVQSYS